NETKLPELVSVASATPVCSALYTSFDGIDTIEAPAACHIAAKVGPAERTLSPLMSSGLRMQPRLEAIAPASHASASTTTPALSICALDRKSTRLNSSHGSISYAVFCLKKKTARA